MFRSTAICIAAALLFACENAQTTTKPTVEATPAATADAEKNKTTAFDAERAFNHVKTQVAFGPRPAGSAAIEKTREYLVKELKSYGLNTSLDEFTDTTPHGKVKFKNVIAELPGETANTVIISSHYDTKEFKEFKFVGANDGGSSTGILLEIARVMAADKQKRKFTYQFVFFDGEEAFCHEWSECLNGKDNTYGSRHYAEKLKKEKHTDRVKAMILLDMVGDQDLVVPREDNSSGWLVNAIWSTAREIGHLKHFPNQSQSTTDDHIAFLQAGIPAVDLIDFDYGDANSTYWHTAEDTLDKISAQSLKIIGDVILLSLPKVEAQIR